MCRETIWIPLLLVGCGSAMEPVFLAPSLESKAVEKANIQEQKVQEQDGKEQMGRLYEGVLDIDRASGGKRLQGTWLQREGRETMAISYRPQPEYFQYVEKRVKIIGERYRPDPMAQQISTPHLIVHSIELAEGETPWDPIP